MSKIHQLEKVLSSELDGDSWEIVDHSGIEALIVPPGHLNDKWSLQFRALANDCALLRRTASDGDKTYTMLFCRNNDLVEENHPSATNAHWDISIFDGGLTIGNSRVVQPHWWGLCRCASNNWNWEKYVREAIKRYLPDARHGFDDFIIRGTYYCQMVILDALAEREQLRQKAELVPAIVEALETEVLPLFEKSGSNPLADLMKDRGTVPGTGNRIGWRLQRFWQTCTDLLPKIQQPKKPLEFVQPD